MMELASYRRDNLGLRELNDRFYFYCFIILIFTIIYTTIIFVIILGYDDYIG